jgi:SAM-dependent methyltransferase
MAYRMQERLRWGHLATPRPDRRTPVYNWFHYKEGFSRELVMQLLGQFSPGKEEWVLDPFCGVGTTMLACLESGVNSVGFDVNPVSVFASRVKLNDYDRGRLREELSRLVRDKFVRSREGISHPLINRVFPPRLLEQVLFYRELVLGIRDRAAREFLMLALMNAAVKSSYLRKDGAVLKVRKRPVPPLRGMLRRESGRMLRDLEGFPRSRARAIVDFGDARAIRLEDCSVGAVITSPPYLNKTEYTRIYEVEEELFLKSLGALPPAGAFMGLGPGRLERDSSLLIEALDEKTVNGLPHEACPYFVDMAQAIREIYRVCKPGARVGLVVGNGCFPNGVVESDVLLSRIAEGAGFRAERIVVLNKRWCTRRRTIKVGIARESLLLWRKA